MLLALALRLGTLGLQSLDADEGFTAQIARRSFGDAMAQIPRTESTPPLYYALVWLWTQVFGTGEWGLRSLSALAGVAAVPVIYAIGAALRSPRVGLIAAAFATVSPLLVWYSQEARAYMLLMLLTSLAFLFVVRERVWLWALASAAALATHYFAAVVIAPMALWMLWRRVPRARWAIGAVTLAGLALLPLLRHQNEHVTRTWAEGLTVKDEVAATSQSFLIGMTWNGLIHRPGVIVLGLLALVLAWRARHDRAALLPAGVAAFGLVVPLAASVVGGKYVTPGNELGVWPLIAVALAMGATRLLAGAVCVVMLAITLAVPLDADMQRANWRGLVRSLEPAPRGVITLNGHGETPVVRYYLRSPGPVRPVAEMVVLGRTGSEGTAVSTPPLPGMQLVATRRDRRIAFATFTGPPALVPPRAYGEATGSLYQRPTSAVATAAGP